ncbi:hypothetical protein LTR05_001596 [Lithohypha guttulata]|uniref:FHF complex subunit HOOK-interacting protein C-terminal domain-containing protein n=1 Tax=Lithohypha guttulata TaxID=1690604 RepID=A0AAN7YKB6_9EURO|nr:hypothetical protein LTR05_001596 [Lithohypha guttulata]
MDLLQRLIAGSASSKQRVPSQNERLGACKRLCNALQNIWRSSSSLSEDDATASHVANILRRLNTVLEDEARKAAPHSCLLWTAANQIYIIVAKLALSSSSSEVVDHAVHFFHFLINGEVEGVLDSKIFARSLIDLVRRTTSPTTKVVDEQGESALIELLFEICTKIRLDPDILPAWFYPERVPGRSLSSLDARRSQFPLFHLLVDFVHYDGPTGDFARTALLYLTETSPKSRPLEKWMMESDLAHQMASGLSALYARLSRQALSISKRALPILAFSDAADAKDEPDEFYEDAGMDMRAFLSYLAFWQDTLSHCKSSEVRDTLLDSFQVLFVEQLLYPSLLESSDVEGGSTSAVMLHLCRFLDAIDDPQLIERMFSYLFAIKSQPAVAKSQRPRTRISMSRRRSMEQLATLASLTDNPSPELFSLLDLIVFSLRSSNAQTVVASLKLITILLRRHHPHVKHQLFAEEVLSSGARQNLSGLNNTMMTLFDCASVISDVSTTDQSFQAALKDAQTSMEHHSCLFTNNNDRGSKTEIVAISTSCKVLEHMTNLLESWFANDTLVNLELTGALSGLAACEHILMRSWLVPTQSSSTGIMAIITQLVQQVKLWRAQYIEWDAFYSIQKVELASEDELFSLGQPSGPQSEERTSCPKKTKVESSSPSVQAMTSKTAAVDIGSIDGRIASNGSTAVEHGSSRKVSDGSNDAEGSVTSMRSISSSTLSATLLETRIPVGSSQMTQVDSSSREGAVSQDGEADRGTEAVTSRETAAEQDQPSTASLRHVLTQAIILQEFVFELAAALQIRATLFDEVDLS